MGSIPDKIRLFCTDYIIRQDKDEYLEANNTIGEVFYEKHEIYIKSTMPFDRKVKVLFHEAAHGVMFELGAITIMNNEAYIDLLSLALLQLVLNNDLSWVLTKD